MNEQSFKNELDCSNYNKTHILYNELNKKCVGKFKDELANNLLIEFVGIRAKMYSMLFEHEEEMG